MVRLRASVTPRVSSWALVNFPLFVTGLALLCPTVQLMCAFSLTALSAAFKADQYAAFHLASVQPPLRSGLGNAATARLASVGGRLQPALQRVGGEPQVAGAQSLPRRDLQNGTTTALANVPHELRRGIQFIRFDMPALAPMAFTQFCMRYPGDCKPQRSGERIELDITRWSELDIVNRAVNSSIHPLRNEDGLAGEKWLLAPTDGDCNDYAVTKRHQLIAKGWSARAVLLSEVVTASGEHHLVTVVRTSGGDLVLDNLTDEIMPWSRTPYQWVRIQTPKNPNYWASISGQNA
jgi:predicted transglutaminase-like cysteine proteinase